MNYLDKRRNRVSPEQQRAAQEATRQQTALAISIAEKKVLRVVMDTLQAVKEQDPLVR
ncbi:hypothetical protein LB521_09130 [Mesorhizobium sp. BR-1-1-8]|uniref:hypothetical protein n=1 Tax=unclassified Mesorhizobium TaxID=325217 RepID=UPI0015E40FCB|nr:MULTISPECIES: hypothetical protein [unclassified Mesorhizobium]MBZ9981320.1 hypothetical protein [Mesorhizobium sp. BR-1-1-8]